MRVRKHHAERGQREEASAPVEPDKDSQRRRREDVDEGEAHVKQHSRRGRRPGHSSSDEPARSTMGPWQGWPTTPCRRRCRSRSATPSRALQRRMTRRRPNPRADDHGNPQRERSNDVERAEDRAHDPRERNQVDERDEARVIEGRSGERWIPHQDGERARARGRPWGSRRVASWRMAPRRARAGASRPT